MSWTVWFIGTFIVSFLNIESVPLCYVWHIMPRMCVTLFKSLFAFQFLTVSLRPSSLSWCCSVMQRIILQAWGNDAWGCKNMCIIYWFQSKSLWLEQTDTVKVWKHLLPTWKESKSHWLTLQDLFDAKPRLKLAWFLKIPKGLEGFICFRQND